MSQREYHIVVLGSGKPVEDDQQLEDSWRWWRTRWSREKLSNRYVVDSGWHWNSWRSANPSQHNSCRMCG